MAECHDTGKRGEAAALAFLQQEGYRILETNWQSNHQEVDIIALQNNTIVFVEVKTRSSLRFGEPEAFVTKNKQRMLIKAANHYLLQHNIKQEARFDIITVLQIKGGRPQINHITDAFYPDL
jgi:putative endonuclease